LEEELQKTKTQLEQIHREKETMQKSSTTPPLSPHSSTCSKCERHGLQVVDLEEELESMKQVYSRTMARHTEERQMWQKEIEDAKSSTRNTEEDSNLRNLLKQYQEEIETLREENRTLQRSSFSTVHSRSIGGINDRQHDIAIAVAIAAKEDEFHSQQEKWDAERTTFQKKLQEAQSKIQNMEKDFYMKSQKQEKSQKDELYSLKKEWQHERKILEDQISGGHQIEREKQKLLLEIKSLKQTKIEEVDKLEKEWQQERHILEDRLSRHQSEWHRERESLEKQLENKVRNDESEFLQEENEKQQHTESLKEQLVQKEKEWQLEKELLEKQLNDQSKQMEDWKLLIPRNKVLLEQTQAKNENLKTQLEEAREQIRHQSGLVKSLQVGKETLEKELENTRKDIDVSKSHEIASKSSITVSERVLIPADLSRDDLMELIVTRKHVIEWEWHNLDGVGGMYTGWLNLEGSPDGFGVLRGQDGSVYIGFWAKGRKSGQGTFTSIDSDVYSGLWLNDEFHGRGVYVSNENQIYTGDWSNGSRQGSGIETWVHGARYVGQYHHDKRNGRFYVFPFASNIRRCYYYFFTTFFYFRFFHRNFFILFFVRPR
jgi:hypothetical protein